VKVNVLSRGEGGGGTRGQMGARGLGVVVLPSVPLFPTPDFVSRKYLKPSMQHVDEKDGVLTDDSRAAGGKSWCNLGKFVFFPTACDLQRTN
jgi:hypothetical protein